MAIVWSILRSPRDDPLKDFVKIEILNNDFITLTENIQQSSRLGFNTLAKEKNLQEKLTILLSLNKICCFDHQNNQDYDTLFISFRYVTNFVFI